MLLATRVVPWDWQMTQSERLELMRSGALGGNLATSRHA